MLDILKLFCNYSYQSYPNKQVATEQGLSSLIKHSFGTKFSYQSQTTKLPGLQIMVLDTFLRGNKTDQYLLM